MKILKYLVAFLFLATTAHAANIYVRDGGTATGSAGRNGNWNAASCYDQLSSAEAVAVRGDVIYVADGTYSTCTFNVAASGSTYIYVKKATASDHGTETGWSSSYGDGTATFTNSGGIWSFDTAYWDVDGVVGEYDSGHGFLLYHSGSTGGHIVAIDANNVNLRHVAMTQPNYASQSVSATDGINIGNSADYITIQYCYIYKVHRDCITAGGGINNITIEYNFFQESHSLCSTSHHGQAIYMGYSGGSDYWTIRYNVFKNINGSGIIFFSGPCDHIYIYGNLFYEESDYTSECGANSVNGVLQSNDSGGAANYILFYNNTIARVAGRGSSGQLGDSDFSSSSGNTAYNNIWYGSESGGWTGWTHNYNAADYSLGEGSGQLLSSSPFVSYAGDDFTLSAATNAGTTLSSPYDYDMLGSARGEDGTWDRGAYEFTGEDSTPPAVSGRNPASGATGVLESTNIVAHVTDAGDGVDSGTISMTVEGSPVSPSISGTQSDYTLTYNPPSDFSYDQVVNVTIDADDNNGNSMTTDEYSFTIRSEPDTTDPVCTITTPADNPHNNGTDTTADLAGTASDASGIASVSWTCVTCTPSSGSATGTTSWSISNITIAEGNNTFVVTATDDSENSNTGSDSVVISLAGATPTATLSRTGGTGGSMNSGSSD